MTDPTDTGGERARAMLELIGLALADLNALPVDGCAQRTPLRAVQACFELACKNLLEYVSLRSEGGQQS